MNVSLEEAIEIHARVLKTRAGRQAPEWARRHAILLQNSGDPCGFEVWMQVEAFVRLLLASDACGQGAVGCAAPGLSP